MPRQSEYNRRQFELMLDAIHFYEKNQSTLATLVQTLEGLISVVETESESDQNELLQDWGALEEVHALCLEMGKPELERVHANVISKAIENVRTTISRLMD